MKKLIAIILICACATATPALAMGLSAVALGTTDEVQTKSGNPGADHHVSGNSCTAKAADEINGKDGSPVVHSARIGTQ